MYGLLYLAQGKGPHATVLFLHGFPGNEKNIDLAQAVRRAGFNALVFYYRGPSAVMGSTPAATCWRTSLRPSIGSARQRWQTLTA
jgi:esterase/lipase